MDFWRINDLVLHYFMLTLPKPNRLKREGGGGGGGARRRRERGGGGGGGGGRKKKVLGSVPVARWSLQQFCFVSFIYLFIHLFHNGLLRPYAWCHC